MPIYFISMGIFRKSQEVSVINLDPKGSKSAFPAIGVLKKGENLTEHNPQS
jgi:hypothetical protein